MPILKTESKSVRWLIAELTVVVLGILIAFQIEDFRSNRSNRLQESISLELLATDLDNEKEMLGSFLESARNQVIGLRSLENFIRERHNVSESELEQFFRYATVTYLSDPISTTYDSMRTSGSIQLVSDPELLQSLTRYYDSWSPYLSNVISNMREARDAFIEAIGSDIYYTPRDELGRDGSDSIEVIIREPTNDIPRDIRFYGALSSYAFRITFVISRLETGLELNADLRSSIETHLEKI